GAVAHGLAHCGQCKKCFIARSDSCAVLRRGWAAGGTKLTIAAPCADCADRRGHGQIDRVRSAMGTSLPRRRGSSLMPLATRRRRWIPLAWDPAGSCRRGKTLRPVGESPHRCAFKTLFAFLAALHKTG